MSFRKFDINLTRRKNILPQIWQLGNVEIQGSQVILCIEDKMLTGHNFMTH